MDSAGGRLGWATVALAELVSNLGYARDLVRGGQHLERLQVGAFDVADLYRAAWVQAVSALDHWVHRELYDRALGFALNADVERPVRFLKLEIPMSLFEDVHHHSKTMREAFETYLRNQFGHQSFQAPDKIRQALGHVSDVALWPEVAKLLSAETGERVASEQVQGFLTDIVRRRNRIAHEADRDPHSVHDKLSISAENTSEMIDRIQQIATATMHVIGPPPPPVDPPEHSNGDPRKPAPGDGKPPTTRRHTPVGSARLELYRRFWSKFQPIAGQRGWTQAAPPAQNWWNLPAGVTGANWSLSFARFGCRSELYFDHPDPAVNLTRWQILADRRDEIDAHFGDEVIFDDLPNNKGCRIETRLIGPRIEDEQDWPDVLRWMEDTQTRLRSAIDAVGGVPNVIPPTRD